MTGLIVLTALFGVPFVLVGLGYLIQYVSFLQERRTAPVKTQAVHIFLFRGISLLSLGALFLVSATVRSLYVDGALIVLVFARFPVDRYWIRRLKRQAREPERPAAASHL